MQCLSVGRIVHFYPGKNDQLHPTYGNGYNNNGADVLPAIVVQVFGSTPEVGNMAIFAFNTDASLVRRYSVPHKSKALDGQSYWDWPVITPFIPPMGSASVTSSTDNTIQAWMSVDPGTSDLTYKNFSEDNGNQHRA